MKNIILLLFVTFMISCTKPEIKPELPPHWNVSIISTFCWQFHHINSEPDSISTVGVSGNTYLTTWDMEFDNIGDTLHFVVTGKQPIEINFIRNGIDTIITHEVIPYERDTLILILY